MAGQRYSKDQVDAILARAIEHDNKHGELSHDDLVAAAGEVGISREALEKAASEVMTAQSERAELAVVRREQWRGFMAHLIPYVMVNGMLVTLNVLTTHFPWAMFPAVGWGVGLVSHLMAVVHPDSEQLQRRAQRRKDRARRHALKERLRSNARLLEQDVGQGLSEVLQAVARRIESPPGRSHQDSNERVRVPSSPPPSSSSDDEARDRDPSTRDPRRGWK